MNKVRKKRPVKIRRISRVEYVFDVINIREFRRPKKWNYAQLVVRPESIELRRYPNMGNMVLRDVRVEKAMHQFSWKKFFNMNRVRMISWLVFGIPIMLLYLFSRDFVEAGKNPTTDQIQNALLLIGVSLIGLMLLLRHSWTTWLRIDGIDKEGIHRTVYVHRLAFRNDSYGNEMYDPKLSLYRQITEVLNSYTTEIKEEN